METSLVWYLCILNIFEIIILINQNFSLVNSNFILLIKKKKKFFLLNFKCLNLIFNLLFISLFGILRANWIFGVTCQIHWKPNSNQIFSAIVIARIFSPRTLKMNIGQFSIKVNINNNKTLKTFEVLKEILTTGMTAGWSDSRAVLSRTKDLLQDSESDNRGCWIVLWEGSCCQDGTNICLLAGQPDCTAF